jgi:hypothetical protein
MYLFTFIWSFCHFLILDRLTIGTNAEGETYITKVSQCCAQVQGPHFTIFAPFQWIYIFPIFKKNITLEIFKKKILAKSRRLIINDIIMSILVDRQNFTFS